jgi:FkbM family methyltransferase
LSTRYRDAREQVKVAVRNVLHKRNLDLVRNPFPVRVATTLRHLGIDTVLDVGANVGQYGAGLRASGYRGRIVSFEPLSDAYGRLARRCAPDPGWTATRAAIGAEQGELEINVSANSYSSSLLPMTNAHTGAAPGSEYVGVERVPVTTLAGVLSAHDIDPARSWLKIDTQGYEAQVLDGAGPRLAEFAAVQLELSFVPLYAGQALFDELVDRLTRAGFALFGLEAGFSDPRTGRTLQCDGVFVRAESAARAEAEDGAGEGFGSGQ